MPSGGLWRRCRAGGAIAALGTGGGGWGNPAWCLSVCLSGAAGGGRERVGKSERVSKRGT